MAVAASIRLLATVVATADVGATFTASVANASDARATFTADVSRALVDAYEGRSIRTGYKVKLGTTWIPAADLTGEVEISESIDSAVYFARFAVVGSAYSPLVTESTWTRTPVEIWWLNGPCGHTREELRFAGWVRTCSAGGGPGPVVTVECFSDAGYYDKWQLCHELEPLSGMTRGEIAAELCADAGLTAVDFPAGAEYTKPVQAVNARLFDYLRDFIEPEGWKLRPAGADLRTLQAWTPALKRAPAAADDIWRAEDLVSVEIRPPADVPSRWVVRGFGSVYVDEAGQESKVTVTEVEGIYAPKIATTLRHADFSTSATGVTAPAAVLRLVQRVTDTTVSMAGKVQKQDIIEEGWYNPSAAYLTTDTGANAWVGLDVYIDEDQRFVRDTIEYFREVRRQRLTVSYDELGSPSVERTELYRWNLRSRGIINVDNPGVLSVDDVYVHKAFGSASERYETYELAEAHELEREYGSAGAEVVATLSSYGYYSPRTAVSPIPIDPDYYLIYSGRGQSELTATWRMYQKTEKRNLFAGDERVGEVERLYKYHVYEMVSGGDYAWGDFMADTEVEEWQLVTVKSVRLRVIDEDTYERTTTVPGELPVSEIVSGRIPRPRYRWSPWVGLKQEPLEFAIDDPVVEAWFGFSREIIQSDHVQSLEEAQRVLNDRRSRALAYQVLIERHESLARLGDTVALISPDHRLAHRALVTDLKVRRSLQAPSQLGSYTLEVRL